MKKVHIKLSILITFFSLVYLFPSYAQIKLPALVSDSMVLQRDIPLNIWGWASPNEKVKVKFQGKSYNSIANVKGKWQVKLPALKAGGPFEMYFKGKNEIVLKGILIGDVWLCSGQSNMVHQMGIHNVTYEKDIAEANFPEIRQFWVPTATNMNGPEMDVKKSGWKPANPKNVENFSAVAYFFARDIHQKHGVPIGIINSSVGGTPIEAWTSEEGFKDFPAIQAIISKNRDTTYLNSLKPTRNLQNSPKQDPDKGLTESTKWFDVAYKPVGWKSINIPGYWEDQGIKDLNGVVWYRREIEIPDSLLSKPGKLHMGRIVDADRVYINGKEVGNTTYLYPQRRYSFSKDLFKKGKNIIVIRVENSNGKGGFVPDKPYYIAIGTQKIDLKGTWDYKVGQVFIPLEGRRGPMGISEQNQPTALYNAMIAPFINYKVKGVLWYQGESNSGSGKGYEKLLSSLISDWRTKFSQPQMPFYYVQLPNFGDANYLPTESGWALLRESTFKALKIPNTGMAVAIDLGEWNDIHPDNKKGVGDRLALIARHYNYGEKDLIYSGPLYESATIVDKKIVINFNHIGSGLISNDGQELAEFAIAGVDKKFVWAKAKIVGNKVEVWSDHVPEPKYVRYAWADNPVNPNLYNKENLPASPFRTDD
ncbi:sialate O-acetylesterase [Pedobacter cryophilus]|uniref:Sialate O-acetylesterase n=1 Tax=Pedobacter cryophilus TaxID=2571271 RepID=A0A4U1BX00_9SPHI|nr:sialate O-acetylesterase [Pedobacter cryophilus]TKB95726.1 sialate O-acetylesterase [Pedobacter cryophilus]